MTEQDRELERLRSDNQLLTNTLLYVLAIEAVRRAFGSDIDLSPGTTGGTILQSICNICWKESP